MKKSLVTLLLAICVGVIPAFADKKVMNVKSIYNTIHAATGAKVTYNPESSKTTVIEINGPADKINWVEIIVSNGTLNIRAKEESNGNRNGNRIKGVTITVSGPLVRNLKASSAGEITSTTWLEFRKSTLSLSASSSGEIKLANVSSPTLIATASSSGEISIGTVNSSSVELSSSSSGDIDVKAVRGKMLTAKSSSSGDIDISSADCTNVSIGASSSGDVKITKLTTSNLNAKSSSSGDIVISGSADRATLSASSGGDIDVRRLSSSNTSIRTSSGGSIYER